MKKQNISKNKNHSRVSLSGISSLEKTKAAEAPDTNPRGWHQAFTLIELLVVVLIIGILAAVALPQYQRAVLKSRYMQLMTVADAICRAEQVYYMANGEYTSDAEALDVQFPAGGSWYSDNHVMSYDNFYFQISTVPWVQGYLRSSGLSYVNYCNGARRECRSYNQTTSEQAVCLSMGGVKQNCTSCQWDEYILNN